MRSKSSDDLRSRWNLCRWLQNISPGISGTAQEFIDGSARGPGVQFAFQPLYNPCQHLNIGIGAVRIGTITVEVFRKAANLMVLLQWKERTRQRQRIKNEKCWRQRHAQPLAGSLNERPIVARAIMRDERQFPNIREECLQGFSGKRCVAHFTV